MLSSQLLATQLAAQVSAQACARRDGRAGACVSAPAAGASARCEAVTAVAGGRGVGGSSARDRKEKTGAVWRGLCAGTRESVSKLCEHAWRVTDASPDTYPRDLYSYSSLVRRCISRHLCPYPRELFSYSSLVGGYISRHLPLRSRAREREVRARCARGTCEVRASARATRCASARANSSRADSPTVHGSLLVYSGGAPGAGGGAAAPASITVAGRRGPRAAEGHACDGVAV